MLIPKFIKQIYYRFPLPEFIKVKISGRLFTKKFNEEIRNMRY